MDKRGTVESRRSEYTQKRLGLAIIVTFFLINLEQTLELDN